MQHWHALRSVIDAGDALADVRFATNADRIRCRADVDAAVGGLTAALGRDELIARLREAEVPCAPINTVDQLPTDPQVLATGMLRLVPHDEIEDFTLVNLPMTFNGGYTAPMSPPPALGADTDAVLARLGYSVHERAGLSESGAVALLESGTSGGDVDG